MDSQKLAGILGTIVALLVMASVVIYGPKPDKGGPKQPATTEAPKAPVATVPAPRGPVVREVPQ
jgi:hypothetical protein